MSAVAVNAGAGAMDRIIALFCDGEVTVEIARAIKNDIRRNVIGRSKQLYRIACIRDQVQFRILAVASKDSSLAEQMTRNLDNFNRA